MKIKKIMPVIVLSSICLVVTLLLAVVNMFTAPIIEQAMNDKANAALLDVLPDGKNFEEMVLDENYPKAVTAGYRADGGYVFRMDVTGKSAGLVIMCGIDSEGRIVNTKIIADNETDSYDANVFPYVEGADGVYNGMSLEGFEPYLVSGATLTSKAYSEAIKAALQSYAIAGGGSVDLRTPEQILNDNLNLALGTEGKTFEKWFATEVIGADALYITDGGVVALADGYYVGISADGEVSTEGVSAETGEKGTVGDATYATVNSSYVIYKGATLTEVDISSVGAYEKVKHDKKRPNLVKGCVTESGNYVFELEASGYGKQGDYASDEYIKLKVAISKEGKIISTLTVSQAETNNIGSVCGTPEFYERYNGTDATTYESVENITGATVTSDAYKYAIDYAFEAFEKLTGGAVDEQ